MRSLLAIPINCGEDVQPAIIGFSGPGSRIALPQKLFCLGQVNDLPKSAIIQLRGENCRRYKVKHPFDCEREEVFSLAL